MESFELSDILLEFLNENFHQDKVRNIRLCLDYVEKINNSGIYTTIDISSLITYLDNILYNIDTLGRNQAIDMIDGLIFDFLLTWLERLGIFINQEQLFIGNGIYERLLFLLIGLNSLITPETETAYIIKATDINGYPDKVEWLSELLSRQTANTNMLYFYEIIEDISDGLKDYIIFMSNYTLYLSKSTVDNNIQAMLSMLYKYPNLLHTYIVEDVFINNRGLESIEENVKFVLDKIMTKDNCSIDTVPYELTMALILSLEFAQTNDVSDQIDTLPIDVLKDKYTFDFHPDKLLSKIKETAQQTTKRLIHGKI